MATEILLLGYTPDRELKYSQHKRGWPTGEGINTFYPVCNKCDGYGTVYGYSTDAFVMEDFFPRPRFVDCPCCGGSGWAHFVLSLNINNVPNVPRHWC